MVERIGKEEGRLLSNEEFQRAKDELKAAMILHENGVYYKSVSSTYYAVYHAAKSLLLLKGVVPQSHEGIERMFSLYYVKTNEVRVEIGKVIGRLMKLREQADYYPETPFSAEDSREALTMAKTFVEEVEKVFHLNR